MPKNNMQESPSEWDLSIITVCRNVKDSISKTVQSVLAQKKKASISIEHVYVDGDSTDGTPELLEQLLQNGDIEQYVSEPDKGIYDAMNKGIRMARGKVLFFLNSDDILIEETDLAHLVRPIMDGECDATYGQWYLSDRPNEYAPPLWHLCYTVTPCCHQAYFMSKEWYEKLGGYEEETFRCAGDTNMMWATFSKGARIVHVEHPVVMFVMGGFSFNAPVDFLNESVLITWRHRGRIAQHMRKSGNYSRFIAQYLATNILIYPLFVNNGGKHIHETAQRLRELCDIVCRSGIGLADRCILKLLAHFGLRAFEAGKTGRVRQLFLRIPCLFLEEPTDAKYTRCYWPLSLKARVLHRSSD